MPNIDGLLARCPADFTEDMNFHNNMQCYFSSRGMKMPWLYYQADPIAAHIGGVSQVVGLKPGEQTFLLVCGTGMATADEQISRAISRTPIMTMDEELFPKEETEGYIYESGCSGLLFYGLMRRAINLRKKEPGTALQTFPAEQHFASSNDSALVSWIWESTIDEQAFRHERLQELRAAVTKEAFSELQTLASLLMQRLHITLANAILATAVKMNRDRGFHPYYVVFEGNVALNPHSFPEIVREVPKRLQNTALFAELGVPVPVVDLVQRPMREVFFCAGNSDRDPQKDGNLFDWNSNSRNYGCGLACALQWRFLTPAFLKGKTGSKRYKMAETPALKETEYIFSLWIGIL